MAAQFTEDRALWLYQHYIWLETHLPKRPSHDAKNLILPTKKFFPDNYKNDHASAELVFKRVRDLMGMAQWPCQFQQDHSLGKEVESSMLKNGILGRYSGLKESIGTFSVPEAEKVVISYSTALLKNPIALVSTLSHELCHYLIATINTPPPSTWKELEPLTDLAAIVEGFGVFLCSSAFQFSQWTSHDKQGWSFSSKGYLTETEIAFSLGIYCIRNRIDPILAAPHLKPNAHEVFSDSLGYITDLEENGINS